MLSFYLKESVKIIGRAIPSFLLSLTSIFIAVVLISISLISIELSEALQNKIKSNFGLEIFLKENLSENEFSSIQKEINNAAFFSSIVFISKERAAEIFIKETGEDFARILDYNPLPSSFSVKLKPEYLASDSLQMITASLQSLNGIDEVVYKEEYLNKIVSTIERFKFYILIAAIILILISIYLVYSTVSAILKVKADDFETMKLVGAKISTIKIPIILNAILIGLFSSILASGVILYLLQFIEKISTNSFTLIKIEIVYILFALFIGPALGFAVSLFAVRNISLKI
ncbi:MAG TPA: permease-like cell division protein FtsX [Ignavibacteriaceae bacterium]|nr:permease-like cell division protein FtsX [Ignavibacteriaceae bacterium]